MSALLFVAALLVVEVTLEAVLALQMVDLLYFLDYKEKMAGLLIAVLLVAVVVQVLLEQAIALAILLVVLVHKTQLLELQHIILVVVLVLLKITAATHKEALVVEEMVEIKIHYQVQLQAPQTQAVEVVEHELVALDM
jgi:hypothetical protein